MWGNKIGKCVHTFASYSAAPCRNVWIVLPPGIPERIRPSFERLFQRCEFATRIAAKDASSERKSLPQLSSIVCPRGTSGQSAMRSSAPGCRTVGAVIKNVIIMRVAKIAEAAISAAIDPNCGIWRHSGHKVPDPDES